MPGKTLMKKQFVAVVAGGVGLSVAVASTAALTYALNPPVAPVNKASSRPARILCETDVRQVAEETVEPSVLMVPTVTIVGDRWPARSAPRGAAEMQRADEAR